MKGKSIKYLDNDGLLVKACIKENQEAIRYLYHHYSKPMFGLCLRIMGNRQDAEDVFQNAFVSVFTKLKSYKGSSPLKYWIKRIFVNHSINELKKRKNYKDFKDREVLVVEDSVEIEYNIDKIRKGISELPDGYRTVLNLYLFEGYDHKEISSILNISESTSKSQYSRAKFKLKKILTKTNQYG
jgi:RNA polymerase sigma-70 factor (ECF subfamily)